MSVLLAVSVAGGFELEGRVLHIEMAAQALAEPVEHDTGFAALEHLGLDHHMRGEHRGAGRDRPDVHVVNGDDPRGLGQVLADLLHVHVARGRLGQHHAGRAAQRDGGSGRVRTVRPYFFLFT